MASVAKQPDWRENPSKDQPRTVLGNSKKNFWIWSQEGGFDLTHPPTPDSDPVVGRLKLQCSLTPIVIDPVKTALLIIDFGNYDMHAALGNDNQAWLAAEKMVLPHAVPAARQSGMQVVWLTTGHSGEDLADMEPAVFRTFNWQPVIEDVNWPNLPPGQGFSNKGDSAIKKASVTPSARSRSKMEGLLTAAGS